MSQTSEGHSAGEVGANLARATLNYLRSPFSDVNSKKSTADRSIPALDGVRGLAVLIVIASNTSAFAMSGQGILGILLLFTLSGYLLAQQFVGSPRLIFRKDVLFRFFLNRFLSVFPIFAVSVLLYALLTDQGLRWSIKQLLFVSGWNHLWTAPEIARFYLAFPFVISAIAFASIELRLFLLALGIFLAWQIKSDYPIDLMDGTSQVQFYLYSFLTGVFASFATPWATAITRHRKARIVAGALSIAILLAFFLASDGALQTLWKPVYGSVPDSVNGWNYSAAWQAFIAVFIVCVVACPETLASKLMSLWFVRHVGLLSAGIYLFHVAVLMAYPGSGTAVFIVVFLSSYVIAIAGYLVLQKPFLLLKSKDSSGVDAQESLVPQFSSRLGFWLVFAVVCYFSYSTEVRVLGHILVLASFLLFFVVLRILWLGTLTSSVLSFCAVLAIYHASKFKFWLTARRLHPHDIYLYFNLDNLLYTRVLYPNQYLLIYTGLALFVVLVAVLIWLEGTKRPRLGQALGLFAVLLLSVGIVKADPYLQDGALGGGNGFMHFDHQHVSTFALSTIFALPELMKGKAFDYGEPLALDPVYLDAFSEQGCKGNLPRPDMILVMRESGMIPSSIPEMDALDLGPDRFASSNGKTYRLRVETHGAGSAHSIFSALTGISAASFGSLMNIGVDLSRNKIKASLPQVLKNQCGYRTIAITTGVAGYVLDRSFFESLEFSEFYDLDDVTKITKGVTSDKAIYAFVEHIINQSPDDRPLFIYLDTTDSHGPYDKKIRPDEEVPEATIQDPEINEYVRRLFLGERDLEAFVSRMRTRAVDEHRKILIADFGDHQPAFTKYLPGRSGRVNYERMSDDDLLFTFVRFQALGFNLGDLPSYDLLDVAFLGDWMARAAQFQIGGLYEPRWAFVEDCKSRYWQCSDGAKAHEFHQALRAAKLISIP